MRKSSSKRPGDFDVDDSQPNTKMPTQDSMGLQVAQRCFSQDLPITNRPKGAYKDKSTREDDGKLLFRFDRSEYKQNLQICNKSESNLSLCPSDESSVVMSSQDDIRDNSALSHNIRDNSVLGIRNNSALSHSCSSLSEDPAFTTELFNVGAYAPTRASTRRHCFLDTTSELEEATPTLSMIADNTISFSSNTPVQSTLVVSLNEVSLSHITDLPIDNENPIFPPVRQHARTSSFGSLSAIIIHGTDEAENFGAGSKVKRRESKLPHARLSTLGALSNAALVNIEHITISKSDSDISSDISSSNSDTSSTSSDSTETNVTVEVANEINFETVLGYIRNIISIGGLRFNDARRGMMRPITSDFPEFTSWVSFRAVYENMRRRYGLNLADYLDRLITADAVNVTWVYTARAKHYNYRTPLLVWIQVLRPGYARPQNCFKHLPEHYH